MNEPSILHRQAARVILIDPKGRTLLFLGGDPDTPGDEYWFTPGGGLEPGESLQAAARREVWEEVGVLLDEVGPEVHREEICFPFMGQVIYQKQVFFRAQIPTSQVCVDGWDEVERHTVKEHRWWTRQQIQLSRERIYPENLLSLLPDVQIDENTDTDEAVESPG